MRSGTIPSSAAVGHCAALVRVRDEDRWLAANYAPLHARARLHGFYAAMSEIALTPARVSEPPLGEIRLQWWREALDEIAAGRAPRAHPAVEAIAEAGLTTQMRAAFEAAIESHARLLYQPIFTEAGLLESWYDAAEGQLAAAAGSLIAPITADEALAVRSAGAAYALARHGARLAPGRQAETAERARALHEAARSRLKIISAALMPAVAHFALTPLYLASQPPGGLVRRAVILRAVISGRI